MATSSDKLGSFSLTYKYCKYRLRDNISGDAANTQSNIINDDSFWEEVATNSVKIGLKINLDLGRRSIEIGELYLSHHLI